jgi:hypothetical protein
MDSSTRKAAPSKTLVGDDSATSLSLLQCVAGDPGGRAAVHLEALRRPGALGRVKLGGFRMSHAVGLRDGRGRFVIVPRSRVGTHEPATSRIVA